MVLDDELVDFVTDEYARLGTIRPVIFARSEEKFFLVRYLDVDEEFLRALSIVLVAEGVTRGQIALSGRIGEGGGPTDTFLVFEVDRGRPAPEVAMFEVGMYGQCVRADLAPLESDRVSEGPFAGFLQGRPSPAELQRAHGIVEDRRAKADRFIIRGL